MRAIPLFIAICMFPSLAQGQEFWGHLFDLEADVPYGEEPLQVADVYLQGHRPTPGQGLQPLNEPRPTVLWFHGGGWTGGDKVGSIDRLIPYIERGWHAVNVNYRIGPGTAPQAVDDAMCAYKWVVDESLAAGRSDRFVVSGSSAGGHLALIVGLLNTTGDHPCRAEIAPSAVVNWYGVTDIEAEEAYSARSNPDDNFALEWIGNENRVAEISLRFSPIELVSASAPPIISIHGTADDIVPYEHAVALHDALTTRNRLITLESGSHGGYSDDQFIAAFTAIFEFLDR